MIFRTILAHTACRKSLLVTNGGLKKSACNKTACRKSLLVPNSRLKKSACNKRWVEKSLLVPNGGLKKSACNKQGLTSLRQIDVFLTTPRTCRFFFLPALGQAFSLVTSTYSPIGPVWSTVGVHWGLLSYYVRGIPSSRGGSGHGALVVQVREALKSSPYRPSPHP